MLQNVAHEVKFINKNNIFLLKVKHYKVVDI